MALHLITGYAGQEHITSADQGAYNMGTFGEGEFVLDRGSKFAATVVTNNQITIANGEALMQGRFIKLAVGTTESVAIDNGASGMKRKDLIVLRYSKDAGTGIESVALAVKKGTPSSGTPSDPAITTGTITDGTDLVNEMKLYRVNLDGLNIVSIDTLFSLKTTMVEYMDEYQLPVADANTLGGVKIGTNITRASDGKISIPNGTSSTKGVLQVGSGLSVSSGVVSVPNGTTSSKGILQVGSDLSVSNGVVSNAYSLPTASNLTKGGVKTSTSYGTYMQGEVLAVQNATFVQKGIVQIDSSGGLNVSAGVLSLSSISRDDISISSNEGSQSISANGSKIFTFYLTDSTVKNRLKKGFVECIKMPSSSKYVSFITTYVIDPWRNNPLIHLRIINLTSSAITIDPDIEIYYAYFN